MVAIEVCPSANKAEAVTVALPVLEDFTQTVVAVEYAGVTWLGESVQPATVCRAPRVTVKFTNEGVVVKPPPFTVIAWQVLIAILLEESAVNEKLTLLTVTVLLVDAPSAEAVMVSVPPLDAV